MTAPNETLRTILPIAGWGDGQAADVVFTGGADPVLPTPFCIGAAGAAALAASGLAATELWRARTGRRQRVTVDLRQATAALRSSHYIQLAGTGVSSARNTIMGFYPTRDGRWSYLHCNFPNHRSAALGVLGVAEDRDAVARAVATWNAADLEEAIIAAKGAGGMARTQAEWARHPQGAAVAALPLMEIMRIGDSAPEPLPTGDRPNSICAPRAKSISCAGWYARRMSSRKDIVLALWPAAACRQRSWLRSGLGSSAFRSVPSVMPAPGRRDAASTRWCKPSAA